MVLLLFPAMAGAQDDCFPSSDSHEAQTFAILSAPLAFSGAGGGSQGIGLGFEMTVIPMVPGTIATPTTCRPGKGPENTNPVVGFGRLRAGLAIGQWRIDAGWIPPVPINGVRSNLVGIGIARMFALGARWNVTPRLHALVGRVRGPFTCDAEALEEATSECFGGTVSNDRWDPNIMGIEAAVARRGGRVVPHLGLGWSSLWPRFQVDFTNSLGDVDRRRVEVDLQRVAAFGGMTVAAGSLRITGEGYYTFSDRVVARVVARLPLQGGRDAASP